MHYDLVIYDAEIVDGSGGRSFPGDLAVKQGRISKLGSLGPHSTRLSVNARGLTLAPGFIDSHSHADLTFVTGSAEHEKILMGVTTEVIGQCGFSAFPVAHKYGDIRRRSMSGFLPGVSLPWDWTDLNEYRAAVEKKGMTHHAAPLVGHGSVRQTVMGDSTARPNPTQLTCPQSMYHFQS